MKTKQVKKDYTVAAKVTLGILTLGYSVEGLMIYEGVVAANGAEIALATGQTIFAADDITGTVIGAAKNDLEGDYKPVKSFSTYLGGKYGAITYDATNLFFSGAGTYKDFKSLPTDKGKFPNIFLDGYGNTSGINETSEDIKSESK